MATFEMYHAKADPGVALAVANETSPFTIDVRFLGGLTDAQKDAFKGAADRWVRMIVGDLPSVLVNGELVDDILILAQGTAIDGPGRILGQAGPRELRPATAGNAAHLPVTGIMSFDTADLKKMEQEGTLQDVITHEMGHVLGIGTLWRTKSLLKRADTTNPTFVGKNAKREYGKLLSGNNRSTAVPVENEGGQGTRGSHWRESVFVNELMSGFIDGSGNPISRMTVASLQDLGYVVDMDAAEPYSLPDLHSIAASGLLMERTTPLAMGIMLPVIPIVLPEDSLQ